MLLPTPVLSVGSKVSLLAGLLATGIPSSTAAQASDADVGPKRVLIINSFGREFGPFPEVTAAFRTEVARELGGRVEFVEASLQAMTAEGASGHRALVLYLQTLFQDHAPDLLVAVAAPAANFLFTNRDQVFPNTPLLVIGYDAKRLPSTRFGPNDTGVPIQIDPTAAIEQILRVLPDTRAITVILGASAFERFWIGEFRRRLGPLANQIAIEFVDSLPFNAMRERLATLPPHSAILHVGLMVDAAGIPWEHEQALAQLRGRVNAPMFGMFSHHIGPGIVGGALINFSEAGVRSAQVARRLLAGEKAGTIPVGPFPLDPPVFDGTELRRWGIEERLLPPGSVVVNRPAGFWEQYGRVGIIVLTIVGLQAALIGGLTLQWTRRRRAEVAARALSHRLITAHEDERRRLARELHDDLTQRLACVAIDAAELERADTGKTFGGKPGAMRQALVRLSDDVHALSYRLHPSILDDLGLAEALKAECGRVANQESLAVVLEGCERPSRFPADTALALYRVAQELLRNAARHAKATRIVVSLESREHESVLTVRDDGVGFDPSRRAHHSLGIAGMRERMHLLGGALDIQSAPGRGTVVVAKVPVGVSAA